MEYQCQKCKRLYSPKEYTQSHFCLTCKDTFLIPHLPRRYWLFQFNPDIYNWFGYMKENPKTEQWLATRHSKEICVGDFVAIWASGKIAGIYATAEVTLYSKKRPLNPLQAKYFSSENDLAKFRKKPSVTLKYDGDSLPNPILLKECSEDDVLSSMDVFTAPQATNFRLSRIQYERINEKLKRQNYSDETK